MQHDQLNRSGKLILRIQAERPALIRARATKKYWERNGRRLWFAWLRKLLPTDVLVLEHANAYVNTGLNNALDREFGLGGAAIGYIGLSNNASPVTAATVFLNGASGGAAANTIIKAISPVASRVAQTTTAGATFVNADFTAGVFIVNKIGLLTTSTDAGTGLVDVIGGAGGSSPYNRTFALDLTAAGTFTFTGQIAVTAAAV